MKYYLDGIELRGMPVPISPREVAAVEVYKGAASLPGEFAGFRRAVRCHRSVDPVEQRRPALTPS